jgi:hypothetical protein
VTPEVSVVSVTLANNPVVLVAQANAPAVVVAQIQVPVVGVGGVVVIKDGVGSPGVAGVQGLKGDTGLKGDIGVGLLFKGAVASLAELPSIGNVAGDLWVASSDGFGYVWSGVDWTSTGAMQAPAANIGTIEEFTRALS